MGDRDGTNTGLCASRGTGCCDEQHPQIAEVYSLRTVASSAGFSQTSSPRELGNRALLHTVIQGLSSVPKDLKGL